MQMVTDHLGALTNLNRCQMNSTEQYLFACGDFQQAEVQERIFGRRLAGKPDALIGFCREPFVQSSGVLDDRVDGMVFGVTDADLAAADAYEPPNYRRSKVKTASGLFVWVYLRQN
jgi:hypothetical protein